jgi:hypothetical protein
MTKIKKYFEFLETSDVLYVFDFDDTLVNSPEFEELAIEYLQEDVSIRDMISNSLSKIKSSKEDLRWENGRIYIDDPQLELPEIQDYWVRKGKRLYMISPNEFYISDISLPKSLKKEISDLYKSVENKCIVTARVETLRDKVTKTLMSLGLDLPKYGLHMIPVGRKNAGTWKGEKIVEIVKNTGFTKVIFYDDNPKFIKKARTFIKNNLPDLDLQTVKIN